MSPLAAIRHLTAPKVQTLPLPGAEPPPAARLPLEEMRDLPPAFTPKPLGPAPTAPTSFGDMLERLVNEVNQKQTAAGAALSGLMSGQSVSLHQAMIAMEEASVSFQLMVEVRNKLVESYQELMRMQV
jgi:flagellar hook-basal body complex protein FliE